MRANKRLRLEIKDLRDKATQKEALLNQYADLVKLLGRQLLEERAIYKYLLEHPMPPIPGLYSTSGGAVLVIKMESQKV